MKILLFCTVFVANAAFSQKTSLPYFRLPLPAAWQTLFWQAPQKTVPVIPAHWAAQNMGVICRYEWKLESTLRLPVRFRVGSVAECDWLEQKPQARRMPPNP